MPEEYIHDAHLTIHHSQSKRRDFHIAWVHIDTMFKENLDNLGPARGYQLGKAFSQAGTLNAHPVPGDI